jgi:hypothetical protein
MGLSLKDSQFDSESRRVALLKLCEERDRRLVVESMAYQVSDAMKHPYHWLRNFTETYNQHWKEEGRKTPYERFPDWPYFPPLFDLFIEEPIVLLEKSRTVMASWAVVGYFTWEAMRVATREIVFQTQKEKKVKQLIKYAKTLYGRQPQWMQDAHPLIKPLERQSDLELVFANGSFIMGIPGGGDQIRSYHPWGYYSDETAFQPEAGECYDHALAAAQKIILSSSAGPGWYADFKKDSVLNVQE